MRAIVVTSGSATVEEVPKPDPGGGEVLVQVRMAGICGTDLEILKGLGSFEGILGHEFVGRVVSSASSLNGKRVVADINCVCGRCDMCSSGLSNHCRRRTVVGINGRSGAFAEFVAVPERNCVEVPDAVSDEEAVFAEPLAAAYQITRQVMIERRMSVAVLGTGRLGLLAAQVLASTGCRLIAIGRNPKTLSLLDRRRIRTCTQAEVTQWGDFDVVVDCTGSPEGLPLALRLVRPRGTIVMKTTCAGDKAVDLTPLIVNEVTLLGSRCGSLADALSALARKEVDVASMISLQMALSEGVEALRLAGDPAHMKVLLKVAE